LNRRFVRGFSVNGSYTLARHLSDAGGAVPTSFAAENGATTLDLFRGDADYGNVAFTRRHRFVSTFLYELPLGKNRRFGGRIGRGMDAPSRTCSTLKILIFRERPTSHRVRSGGSTRHRPSIRLDRARSNSRCATRFERRGRFQKSSITKNEGHEDCFVFFAPS
jgi:hypothetical protein